MEEGKNEIMELRQMIEGCFERQNKLIARLEMELEALSNFNGTHKNLLRSSKLTTFVAEELFEIMQKNASERWIFVT